MAVKDKLVVLPYSQINVSNIREKMDNRDEPCIGPTPAF
jgi:hypothetical protein